MLDLEYAFRGVLYTPVSLLKRVGAEIAVKLDDLVDRDAEIERLTKEKARLESEVARVEKKLTNQGFVSKAPQKLVDEEKAKGEKYREMLATVIARLDSLK